jgi:hypothetical protein
MREITEYHYGESFRLKYDKPNKPIGLIGEVVGANTTIFFGAQKTPQSVCDIFAPNVGYEKGIFLIEYLRSYENMGTMSVSMYNYNSTINEKKEPCSKTFNILSVQKNLISYTIIDCQDNSSRISVPVQKYIYNRNRNQGHQCLAVQFEIIHSIPKRMKNKIKLLELKIF